MRGVLPAFAAFLLAGCFTAATGTPAAAPTGQIDGAVVDGLLNPYPYQNVTLVNLGLTDQTSKLGGFTFRDVPPGTYTLVSQHPGTDGDIKVVEVRPHTVTRVILQLLVHHDPLPFVESLKNKLHTDLALEGPCACTWTKFVLQRPEEIVLLAQWDNLPVGGNDVTVRLVGEEGKVFGSATGASPLELVIQDGLPSQEKVSLAIEFPSGFTPRPFDLSFVLDFYYGADRQHQGSPR
ncbi:MAG TPA: carboxypeptidase-like regulatory domain-containing protein [Candidatus Thermoplasmatota archaeon]|nr:carboxypeptidase-like regulatory domain-containing protein [Candidatus Thermoplasmatota archaeon]